jgi:hypothetical protein
LGLCRRKYRAFEVLIECENDWSHGEEILLRMVDTLHANIVSLEEQVVKLDY